MQNGRLFILSSVLLSGCSVMDSADTQVGLNSKFTSHREQRTTKSIDNTAEQPEILALLLPQSQGQDSEKVHGFASPEKGTVLKVETYGDSPEAEALRYKVYVDKGENALDPLPEAEVKNARNVEVVKLGLAEKQSAMATPSELPTVPGPSTVKRAKVQERNTRDAQVYVMENRWFSEKIWLYNDGVYAQRNPQKICGHWKKNEALLVLEPTQGGRQIYSPKANGAWQSEAGGLSTLRPDKY